MNDQPSWVSTLTSLVVEYAKILLGTLGALHVVVPAGALSFLNWSSQDANVGALLLGVSVILSTFTPTLKDQHAQLRVLLAGLRKGQVDPDALAALRADFAQQLAALQAQIKGGQQ